VKLWVSLSLIFNKDDTTLFTVSTHPVQIIASIPFLLCFNTVFTTETGCTITNIDI
jgi:hypothetical protein